MENNLKNKKVLITGGLGFIGSNVAKRCLELGAEVSIYDCLDSNSGGNLFNIKEISKSVKVGFHDILDYNRLVEFTIDQDLIFNCAASTSHTHSMREPWLDSDVNSCGTINILEAIRRFNPSARFVHVGTSSQFGKLIYRPADELHPEFPMDIYSANKGVSEKYALIYASAYGLRNSVVRLSNTFGPRACIKSPEFTFNNFFLGQAFQGKSIDIYGSGSQLRNALYVDDAVEALICIANSNATLGETYLAVHDEHHSVSQIAEETVACVGSGSVNYVEWPTERRKLEIGDSVLSNSKLKNVIDWSPKYNLREGLLKTADYYKLNLEHYL